MTDHTPPVFITSFGFLHCVGRRRIPRAHIVVDLRHHFRDPHVSPELRTLTGHDQAVKKAVLSTPGIPELVEATAAAVRAYQAGPSARPTEDRPYGLPVQVAVGCAGGRHRAPVVAQAIARALNLTNGWQAVTIEHRDIDRPVVDRPAAPAGGEVR